MTDPFKPHVPRQSISEEELPKDTHGLRIEFGKYKGERWTRVPVDYIKYLINSMDDCYERRIAEMELERRGDTMPKSTVISNHAIDKASLRVLHIWEENRQKNEGLYSWLSRICDEALKKYPGVNNMEYMGMKLVFAHGNVFPTLKTVMREKRDGEKTTHQITTGEKAR